VLSSASNLRNENNGQLTTDNGRFMLQQPAPQTLSEVFARMRAGMLNTLPHLITGIMVFALFWVVARVGEAIIAYAAPRVRADTGVVLLLSRVYYYSVLIFGLVTALGA